MDRLKHHRKTKRAQSTKMIKSITESMIEDNPDWSEIEANVVFLDQLHEQIDVTDQKIADLMFEEMTPEDDQNKETEDCSSYKLKYLSIKKKVEKALRKDGLQESDVESSSGGASGGAAFKRNFRLPKIELRKFTGELTDWLSFWSQFEKIDEDESLHSSDKFHYLSQAMTEGTDAFDIVASYPQSAENYPRVVEALKRRYGNRDFLLQVYIRELLKLVISNVNSNEKMSVEALYIKLESHLRALKSLELQNADPASWLFPLVESSIPEELLITWQRSPLSTQDGGTMIPPKSRLDFMMDFLCQEVEFRQRVILAKGGFHSDVEKRAQNNSRKNRKQEVPTMAGFVAGETRSCVFCEKGHLSQECFKAQKMSLKDKHIILKRKRCCFICFNVKHISRNCKSNVKCLVCKQKHYTLMCPGVGAERKEKNDASSEKTEDEAATETVSGYTSHTTAGITCSKKVPLMTMMVVVSGKKKKLIRATYDPGSQRSYILKSLAREIELEPVSSERVIISLFGGSSTAPTDQNVFKVGVAHESGGYKCTLEVRDRERICHNIPRVSRGEQDFFQLLKANNVILSDVGEGCPEIEMLIGNDYFGQLISGRKVDLKNGITAINTKLGWVLSGTFPNTADDNTTTTLLTMSVSEMTITQLWDLDTIGVRDAAEVKSEVQQAEEAKAKLISTLTRADDGRYCISLPWKEGHPPLSRNEEVAHKRLEVAVKKLDENKLFETYDLLFQDWVKQGFIERVPHGELKNKSHVLPHRPVCKPDSLTTPVRPVFDASCKTGKQPSLNDCLEKGVNLIQLIPDIIMRFREKKVAFISDIKKAFQMIDVVKEDRDYMRFLWYENGKRNKIIEFRHRRVMFGANCSPFILGAVLEHHLTNVKLEDKKIASKLLESMYVDNCCASVDTINEYHEFRSKSTKLMAEAQMDLRLWMSNVDMESENNLEPHVTSVLGLKWDRLNDSFFVNVPTWNGKEITKRVILSYVQQVFDPVGFTSPALITMKMLLQDVWIAKKKWDEVLPIEVATKFENWAILLPQLKEIRIPRMVTGGVEDRSRWSVHLFTDASGDCYAGTVFLRVDNGDGHAHLQLLEARARVAPLKRPSIPRLELLGCLIGSRMIVDIRRSLKLENVPELYWTDSSTALAWIRRQDNWATWVGNRVAEIGRNTNADNWKHVSGKLNPADLPSRGCSPAQVLESRWWEGPTWLKCNPCEWPKSRITVNEEEVAAEKRKTPVREVVMTTLDWTTYDRTYSQHVRIQAYVQRFIHAVKNRERVGGPLSRNELRRAETQLLKEIQAESFPEADKCGVKGLELVKGDDGLLRVRTRIVLREDIVDFKYPILLPRKHPLIRKKIEEAHRNYCHAGVQFLMCKLREHYWIVQSRRAVKQVVERCIRCRRYSTKAVVVEGAPLPLNRIRDADVFQIVGVDLAGPLLLKGGKKTWIVMFTCAVYRAVHLEVVTSLSTTAFIKALQKFVTRHGRPSIIYSDNGSNFVGAANLFKGMDWNRITSTEGINAIEWKFNPPSAAWWGGFWERLIRSMKDIMRRMLGKKTLSLEELRKTLQSVEEVMNERPLTYVSEDANDLQPLTPAMFLRPCRHVQFPEIEVATAKGLRMRYRYIQTLCEELKNRFRREYLSQLIQKPRGKPTRSLRVGEIVIVGRDDKKRLWWPLGRILKLYPGVDGKHRVARVRLQDSELDRPVQRLFPMEVSDDTEGEVKVEKVLRTRYGRIVKPPRN